MSEMTRNAGTILVQTLGAAAGPKASSATRWHRRAWAHSAAPARTPVLNAMASAIITLPGSEAQPAEAKHVEPCDYQSGDCERTKEIGGLCCGGLQAGGLHCVNSTENFLKRRGIVGRECLAAGDICDRERLVLR